MRRVRNFSARKGFLATRVYSECGSELALKGIAEAFFTKNPLQSATAPAKSPMFRRQYLPKLYSFMTIQLKALALSTAFAVSGFLLTPSAQALTPQQAKIQFALQKVLGANVVLENPNLGAGQRLATDAEFAAAVVKSTTASVPVARRQTAFASLRAAFALAVEGSPYANASTTILTVASKAFAGTPSKLTSAVSGAYSGFSYTQTTDDASVAADLIGSSLIGIQSSNLAPAKITAAILTAVRASVKGGAALVGVAVPIQGNATELAKGGAAIAAGAAAQYSTANTTSRLVAIVKAAVSKAPAQYVSIAQAVATAVSTIYAASNPAVSFDANAIATAVQQGYILAHPTAKFSVKATVKTNALAAVNFGAAQTDGAGKAGLNGYAFANLLNGPVTDIYGL